MIPSLGRIVHIVVPEGHPAKGQHRAAIITALYEDAKHEVSENSMVDVTVFLQFGEDASPSHYGTSGMMHLTRVEQDPSGYRLGSFHEPERVEPKVAPAPASKSAMAKA